MKRNGDEHVLNHIKGRNECFAGMAQLENVRRQHRYGTQYYVNASMYKVQISISMRRKMEAKGRLTPCPALPSAPGCAPLPSSSSLLTP